MKISPEVEGIDKARMLLKTLAANPPVGAVSIGLPMRICRDLYAEIREAKARGPNCKGTNTRKSYRRFIGTRNRNGTIAEHVPTGNTSNGTERNTPL